MTADTQHIIGTRMGRGNVMRAGSTVPQALPFPDTTAPRSVTGLTNITYLPTSIAWVSTDPTDQDFDRVIVYLDRAWKTNVTKGSVLYDVFRAATDTRHIIGTRTVDTTGNVNASWVNHTARTAPLPDTTAPRSVTGLTNTTYLPTSITWVWTIPRTRISIG